MTVDLLLAARNLLRNRRRSLATFLALAIGTASILLFGGYRANIQYSMHTAYVREGGHLQIQHRDYFLYGSGDPTRYGIGDYEAVMAALREDPALKPLIAVVTPRLQVGGIASNYDANVSRTALAVGMVAPDVNRMRQWNEFNLDLAAPRFALDGAPADTALVGTGLARVLRLCKPLKVSDCPEPMADTPAAGDGALPADVAGLLDGLAPAGTAAAGSHPRIDLLANSPRGAPNVVSLQVLQTELQGFKELDEIYLSMHLAQTQKLVYGNGPAKVTSILVQLQDTADLGRAQARIQALLAERFAGQPLTVLDFKTLNPFFVQTTTMFNTIFGFIFVLIAAIVLFTVGNTMSTAVMERTVEIGTVRAMGVRRSGIQRMFVLEGMLLGVSGALSGALFAIVVAAGINALGLTWMPPGSVEHLPLLLLVAGEKAMIVGATLALAAVAALSAWWPSYRASRLVIVDALRHV